MKFGGTSLSTASEIIHTCKIVKQHAKDEKIILIVSAMEGVTNQLFEAVRFVKEKRVRKALDIINKVYNRHITTLKSLNLGKDGVKVEIEIIKLINLLEYFIKNISKKEITLARTDYIVSFGERLSCRLVAQALEKNSLSAHPLDASYILATNNKFGDALPLYGKSQNQIQKILLPLIKNKIIPVITGYIGFTHDGCTTTLGRGGSDLSAAFLANFLNAKAVYLWKDVKGFYEEDPHKNKKAKIIKKLTYEKAEALAKKGAKVIYYKAITPVREKNIPIFVKSFIEPRAKGTVVWHE